jgi:hypothetical protein
MPGKRITRKRQRDGAIPFVDVTQLAADNALAINLRMMHAAQKLHGWSTLEQIVEAINAAHAGDPEAVQKICEMVELVQNGPDADDAS